MGRCLYCMQKIEDGINQCPHCQAPIPFAPERPTDLRPGTILQGRYVIGRSLGHGGYGITYLAYDQHLEGIHVIKEYFPKNGGRTLEQTITYSAERTAEVNRTRERFLQEAKMMTQAQGVPNVVRVTNQFEENGTSYILMDYLEGATLNDWMYAEKPGRKFTWQEAVKITVAALDGLKGLHQRGILHRDISCSNIFLCNNGEVYIIDFGNAEWIADTTERPETIQTFYKKPYTAPEQIQGKAQGPATDIYAMAVVLFKTIAGQADASLSGKPLPPVASVNPDIRIPAKLDKIMEQATQQDPAQRIQSAEVMRKQLYDLVKPKHTARNILLSLLAVLILAVGGFFAYSSWEQDSWEEPRISFADQVNVNADGTEKSVSNSETVWIQGTARPGEKMSLTLSREDEILAFHPNIPVDAEGNWQDQISTNDLTVGEDQELRYRIQIKYVNNDRVMADRDLYLLVSNRYADLRIQYLVDPGTASVGQDIYIGGTRQANADIRVIVSEGENTVCEFPVPGTEDTRWEYTFSTSKLPQRDERTSFTISAIYTETGRASMGSLRLIVQPELKVPTMVYTGANPVQDSGAVINLTGTASMNQSLELQVRETGEENAAITELVQAKSDGTWAYGIRVQRLEVADGETRDFEFSIRYVDQPEIAMEGGPLQLRIAIPLKMTTPTISVLQGKENSGRITLDDLASEFWLTGTAARGQELVLFLDGAQFDTDPVTAEASGNWTAGPFTAVDLGAQEGTRGTKQIHAAYRADTNNQSSSVIVNLDIKEILTTPEISFADTTADAAAYLSRDTIRIQGTAKPGKQMTILIEGADGKYSDTPTADVQADGTWSLDLKLSDLGVTLGEEEEFTLQVYYREDNNIRAERILRMTVSNPLFAAPVLTFADGTAGESTIGRTDSLTLLVSGAQPDQELQLMVNNRREQNQTSNAEGKAEFTIHAAETELTNLTVLVRYTAQLRVTSGELTIHIDEEADPIICSNAIEEEATSFSGSGEPGATIGIYDQGELLDETEIDSNGAFTLTWEGGRILTSVELIEVDAFENRATKTLMVQEATRRLIEISKPGNYETYGPNSREIEISGTATGGKEIQITAGEESKTVTAEADGSWGTQMTMPEITGTGRVPLSVAYADGRQEPVSITLTADFETAKPTLRDSLLTQDTTEVHVSIEPGAKARANGGEWVQDTQSTGVLLIPVSGLNPQDGLTVEVEDPYGNTSLGTFEVSVVSSRVEGKIQNPEKERSLSGSETLDILVYVVAGEAANVSSRTVEIHRAESFTETAAEEDSREIFRISDRNAIDGDQLRMVANDVQSSAEEMTQGWKLSRSFSPESSGLEEGSYVLALFVEVNGQRRCLAHIGFQYTPTSVSELNGFSQEGDGWVIRITPDESSGRLKTYNPDGNYNPNSVWISGSYFHDETMTDLSSATFEFYADEACTELLIPPVSAEVGLYSWPADGLNLPFDIANNAKPNRKGEIVSYDAGIILLGAYSVPKDEKGSTEQTVYLVVTSEDISGLALGPFEMQISNQKTTKRTMKSLKNLLAQ